MAQQVQNRPGAQDDQDSEYDRRHGRAAGDPTDPRSDLPAGVTMGSGRDPAAQSSKKPVYDEPGNSYGGDRADSGAGRKPQGDSAKPRSSRKADGKRQGKPAEPQSDGFYNPSDLSDLEDQEPPSKEGLYNEDDERQTVMEKLRYRKNGKSRFTFTRRNKIIAAALSVVVSLVVALGAFFFSGIFNLPNFMKNVEQAGFQRYQVDMNGRTSEWLRAYMELRFSEVDDPNLAPGDRDNLLFRSNNVDTNKPLKDWYKTLRASKFEQDVFERRGIKFTSVAYKDGNIIKFRPGVMSVTDESGGTKNITFDPSQQAFDAIARGDPNVFNGELRQFVDVRTFNNDKEARKALAQLLREEQPQWWKAVKRYHLRQDIQNMIGVRSWKFFENTRNALHEKKISVRNKIITQALPENSKSGEFIKCLFGVPDCSAAKDPANPKANDYAPTGSNKSGDKTDGNPDNPQPVGDGSGETTLKDGADAAAAAGNAAGEIVSKLLAKAGLLSMLDSLARFNEAIQNHTLSKLVAQANAQQVMGLFTVFGVASDQLTTGQVSNSEVRQFMDKFARPTHSEGWSTVINGQGTGSVSAASTGFTEAKNKQQFCSPAHQELMQKYPEEADKEYQWQCPGDKINSTSRAQQMEDAWNQGPGTILGPILDLYHQATGGIFDVFNSVASAITDPIINGFLSVTGTQDDVEHAVAYVGAQALQFGGATSKVNDNTPSGEVGNLLIEGGAVAGETSMRDQGGALTTSVTRALAEKNVIAYNQDQSAHSSLFDRYFSTSNPRSFVSTQFFAIGNFQIGNLAQSMSGIFSSALTAPLRMLTQPTHAAVPDAYAAANFAGIDTYDMPQCPKALDETPQNVTNADELGYFKPSELTWDLVSDKTKWYPALYDKVGDDEDKALQVWNCALMDNTARGGIGARYGAAGEDAFQESASGDSGSAASSGPTQDPSQIEQGSVAELSQKLLSYKSQGKYNCDNPGDCTQLQQMANNQSIQAGACQVSKLDPRVLQLLLYLIEVGKFKVGTFAMCSDHSDDGPTGHSGGFAVDISSVNGQSIKQDSKQVKDAALAMDKFLDNLPAQIELRQQISYGYGEHYDPDLAATQQYDSKLCHSSCVSIYHPDVEAEHENHIHAGY